MQNSFMGAVLVVRRWQAKQYVFANQLMGGAPLKYASIQICDVKVHFTTN